MSFREHEEVRCPSLLEQHRRDAPASMARQRHAQPSRGADRAFLI